MGVGAIVGGVKGANEAQREDVVDQTRVFLRTAIEGTDFTELLRARLAASKAAGDVEIVNMTSEASPLVAEASRQAGPDHFLAIEYRLGLQREHLVNPEVGIIVLVRAQVRDPDVKQLVHQATWAYCGQRYHFVQMAANNAAALRAQIDRPPPCWPRRFPTTSMSASSRGICRRTIRPAWISAICRAVSGGGRRLPWCVDRCAAWFAAQPLKSAGRSLGCHRSPLMSCRGTIDDIRKTCRCRPRRGCGPARRATFDGRRRLRRGGAGRAGRHRGRQSQRLADPSARRCPRRDLRRRHAGERPARRRREGCLRRCHGAGRFGA